MKQHNGNRVIPHCLSNRTELRVLGTTVFFKRISYGNIVGVVKIKGGYLEMTKDRHYEGDPLELPTISTILQDFPKEDFDSLNNLVFRAETKLGDYRHDRNPKVFVMKYVEGEFDTNNKFTITYQELIKTDGKLSEKNKLKKSEEGKQVSESGGNITGFGG